MNDFAQSFDNADYVFVTPIYPAREKAIKGINHKKLATEISKHKKEVKAFDLNKVVREVIKKAGENDFIMLLGAGDIYKVSDLFVK